MAVAVMVEVVGGDGILVMVLVVLWETLVLSGQWLVG